MQILDLLGIYFDAAVVFIYYIHIVSGHTVTSDLPPKMRLT